jgi:hypothetical protein
MKVRLKQHIKDMIKDILCEYHINDYERIKNWNVQIDDWYYQVGILEVEYFEVADNTWNEDKYFLIKPQNMKNCVLLKKHVEPYTDIEIDDSVFDWSE